MSIEKQNKIIKMLITFICYLAYFRLTSIICSAVGLKNDIVISFIADLIFLIGIVFAYKNNLKSDYKRLKKDYKISKIIKVVLLGALVIFVFNLLMGALTELIFPNLSVDSNTESITNLKSISLVYTIFKTMIFAVIAEELLYRETISDVIDNKVVFILVSSTIYTVMNFIFVGIDPKLIFFHFFIYFLPAIIFSTIYVKNHNNIIILMFIKFTYQIIPLTIMLLGLGK